MSGMLIVGSMHLGHPEDMSYKMVEAIKESDVIYTDYMPDNLYYALEFFGMLPESYDIRILKSTNTMFADEYQVKEVVDLIVAGEGQVGIADPGNQFIQACIEEDLKYTIYPGPSSHITAFVASGITNGDFYISCNMEYPEKTIEYFKDQDTPLVIPIWQHRLDEIIELLDTKFKFTNNKNKKVTLCCDMTANEELFITDWVDKIAKNEKLKEIRPYAKIMLVVSDFIKQ
jgi:16S rRNA (cytidine1402-2'-O)-methyltransferase